MTNEQENPLQKIIIKCLEDEDFKKRLMADSTVVFKEEGINVPEGMTINVVEDTEDTINIVIPRAAIRELKDGELDEVSGGWILPLISTTIHVCNCWQHGKWE